jgi:hypothetical protein
MFAILFMCWTWPASLLAQATPTVKQAPPPGITVPAGEAAELAIGLDRLGVMIERLRAAGANKPAVLTLLPDIEVFHKAVRYALQDGEFFKPEEIASARKQLALGEERAQALDAARPDWVGATGPVVRGYRSDIDGSVQPCGVIVPEGWKPRDQSARPLYLWFHGRNDALSEVAFIAGRLKGKREFAPANAFELHLYGRYCNASKFAGEIDAFEAMAEVRRRYPIDSNRIVPMGFSMGGASVWHLATHHAGLWAAASPGAGFAETAVYAKVYQGKQEDLPAPWEKTLYHLYDATDYAANLANLPLIAYSGEKDPQRQSAEIMAQAMAAEGLTLEHLVGPNTAHQYEPETKKELARRIDANVTRGREPMPSRVRFVTYTLRYHQMHWLAVDELVHHWERAEIEGQIRDRTSIALKTRNLAAFTIQFPEDSRPLQAGPATRLEIDGQPLTGPPMSNGWTAHFRKTDGLWSVVPTQLADHGLRKRHGLTGPIDDAFMDAFLFVRPTGPARHERLGAWAASELDRAILEWRRVFRGDARVKEDRAVTAEDIANYHLVLWGDPGANMVLARLVDQLPLRWTKESLVLGSRRLSAADHAPILIYPNPLNPKKYVVLNSGFTFRQGSTTSNSLQTPKLPDWALVDLRTPPGLRWPGQIVDAGFFDEQWQLTAR